MRELGDRNEEEYETTTLQKPSATTRQDKRYKFQRKIAKS